MEVTQSGLCFRKPFLHQFERRVSTERTETDEQVIGQERKRKRAEAVTWSWREEKDSISDIDGIGEEVRMKQRWP